MKQVICLFLGLTLSLSGISAKLKDNASSIGYWDEDVVGLPCFHYTGTLPAIAVKANGENAKIPEDPWFLLGNYQLTLFAHVSGEYELITGQRAWARMNQGERINSGNNASVVKILRHNGIEKDIQLVGMHSEASKTNVCRKTFGCGFAQYDYTLQGLDIERRLSVAPSLYINGGYQPSY